MGEPVQTTTTQTGGDPEGAGSSARSLERLRNDIARQFESGRWEDLEFTLSGTARVAQALGSRDLCLRAQGLRELVLRRTMNPEAAFPSDDTLRPLVNEILFHSSHILWVDDEDDDPDHPSLAPTQALG